MIEGAPHLGRLTRSPLKDFQQDARVLALGSRFDARDEVIDLQTGWYGLRISHFINLLVP